MNKAYSNKALPAGTVLREWRLEEVLGVGGFGIVYKGRGIYFNELVAIKEYFPSAISERDEEATVVPIDSDAEEVHALGLKKFVEEAKLLWNLSTPSRHPNIVSVRSLFEIHGTAYMVMDFEDGTSLSKLLKDRYRFNQRSLWEIIRPIAEGLDRAHRVGVLHRDIKPPNILITPEGRSVLIDFGSARFDTAEATSTQVTFHTPPYAAIEQYVKTYPQGPWTDIYALGVVLYECVTGSKPPEVLERLHGGMGEPLSKGKWPGYSKPFLAAIDSAMTIKPDERPQSIDEWLAQFPEAEAERRLDVEDDDEKTRFTKHEVTAEQIVPVAPPTDLVADRPIETKVPDSPEQAKFKRAGQDTNASRKVSAGDAAAGVAAASAAAVRDKEASADGEKVEDEATTKNPQAKAGQATGSPMRRKGLVATGVAVAVVALGAIGWTLAGDRGPRGPSEGAIQIPDAPTARASYVGPDTGMFAPGLSALADDARAAGVPASAVDSLLQASQRLAQEQARVQALRTDPTQAAAVASLQNSMHQTALAADRRFAETLITDADMRRQRLAGAAPWTDPAAGGGAAPGAAERTYLATLNARTDDFKTAAQAVAAAADGAQSSAAVRQALGSYRALLATFTALPKTRLADAPSVPEVRSPAAQPKAVTPTLKSGPDLGNASAAAPVRPAGSGSGTAAKLSQLNAIIDEGRGMARQVMRADKGENARLARGYDDYLRNLKNSARGVTTEAQAETMIAQAKRTRAYLVFLVKQTR